MEMSLVKAASFQVGDNGTATQNFTVTQGADGTLTLARGNSGATTDDLFTIDASGNVLFPSDTNLLGQSFVSAEQTITAAGSLTIPHGLGASPSLVQCRLICKTTEHNYSVDDEVIVNPNSNDAAGTSSLGAAIIPDATNISIRYGSGAAVFTIFNKTTGTAANITPANWKLIVRAWK